MHIGNRFRIREPEVIKYRNKCIEKKWGRERKSQLRFVQRKESRIFSIDTYVIWPMIEASADKSRPLAGSLDREHSNETLLDSALQKSLELAILYLVDFFFILSVILFPNVFVHNSGRTDLLSLLNKYFIR